MKDYIVKVELVLHVQRENEEKAVEYAANRVYDDLSVCFDDNDDIYITDVIADVERCSLVEEEEE